MTGIIGFFDTDSGWAADFCHDRNMAIVAACPDSDCADLGAGACPETSIFGRKSPLLSISPIVLYPRGCFFGSPGTLTDGIGIGRVVAMAVGDIYAKGSQTSTALICMDMVFADTLVVIQENIPCIGSVSQLAGIIPPDIILPVLASFKD